MNAEQIEAARARWHEKFCTPYFSDVLPQGACSCAECADRVFDGVVAVLGIADSASEGD